MKRLLIVLAILAGLLALADFGAKAVASNATASQIRLHEGLREDPDVTFQGFPFLTQAVGGEFEQVDVTVRDLERDGLTIDRIEATLEGVEVDMGDALKGRVSAVPVREGVATMTISYGDLSAFLSRRPGNIRVVVRDGKPYVVSTFGVPGAGQVEIEGTPTVRTTPTSVRVTVSNVDVSVGTATLTAALRASAAARASFTLPMEDLPFGIEVKSAALTPEGLVIQATAEGLVIDVRDNAR